MTAEQILAELESMGSERYKKLIMKNHGVKEPCFGVKIGDMKKIQRAIKKDYELALALYDSGNYDAMYLAGLIADDEHMTRRDLQHWAGKAYGGALPGCTVAWVAAGSPHGWAKALKWIESPRANIAEAGWATLACIVALKDDSELDMKKLKTLVKHVARTIHKAPDAARYTMNEFLIAVGCYVAPLTDFAIETAESMGTVTADLGDNACTIPAAADYIRKVQKRGTIGKKRKTVKC